MQLFPFLAWLAAMTSAALLVALWSLGVLRRPGLVALLLWFLLAGYCQFFGGSTLVRVVGLPLQTILAIYLILRFRVSR